MSLHKKQRRTSLFWEGDLESDISMKIWGESGLQIMQNILLRERDIVQVRSATLPKGIFVKLELHMKDFLDISNPKAV